MATVETAKESERGIVDLETLQKTNADLIQTLDAVSYTHLDVYKRQISEIINRKPRFICIEDLNVSGMMKNRHLSKAVQEQGFFWFRKQLEYKCSDKGIQLIVADRFYPCLLYTSRCV